MLTPVLLETLNKKKYEQVKKKKQKNKLLFTSSEGPDERGHEVVPGPGV